MTEFSPWNKGIHALTRSWWKAAFQSLKGGGVVTTLTEETNVENAAVANSNVLSTCTTVVLSGCSLQHSGLLPATVGCGWGEHP